MTGNSLFYLNSMLHHCQYWRLEFRDKKIGADKQMPWKENNIKITPISALDFWHVPQYSY